jgi:hypothetical protein
MKTWVNKDSGVVTVQFDYDMRNEVNGYEKRHQEIGLLQAADGAGPAEARPSVSPTGRGPGLDLGLLREQDLASLGNGSSLSGMDFPDQGEGLGVTDSGER